MPGRMGPRCGKFLHEGRLFAEERFRFSLALATCELPRLQVVQWDKRPIYVPNYKLMPATQKLRILVQCRSWPTVHLPIQHLPGSSRKASQPRGREWARTKKKLRILAIQPLHPGARLQLSFSRASRSTDLLALAVPFSLWNAHFQFAADLLQGQ